MDKGTFNGECNRTACPNHGAVWFNHSTRAFYCIDCAALLNYANKVDAHRLFGHDLCTQQFPEFKNQESNF